MELVQWAIRHNISAVALEELRTMFNVNAPITGDGSESKVQSLVRIEGAKKGVRLWRNNVGVMINPEGQRVRYGLANDSKRLNETIKSGDLIGWRPVDITVSMVGYRIAQFVSRECKREDWRYSGSARELAQLRWIETVNADGGDAKFCNGEGTL